MARNPVSCVSACCAILTLGWSLPPAAQAQAEGFPAMPLATVGVETPPEGLRTAEFPGALVDHVVVPVPGEVFAVMDKLGAPDWRGQLRLGEEGSLPTDRVELALVFGATVAESFLAVQAEDDDSLRTLGRRLLTLAAALAIQDRVTAHYRSIIDATDAADWRGVRAEIDRTQQTVRRALEELQDEDLATLVSLGGWLRGTEILTAIIAESYSADRAEVLNQPDLVAHFIASVGDLAAPLTEHAEVVAITGGLGGIHQLMTFSEPESELQIEGGGARVEDGSPAIAEEVEEGSAAPRLPDPGRRGAKADSPTGGASEPDAGGAGAAPGTSGDSAEAEPAVVQAASASLDVEAVRQIGEICSALLDDFYHLPDADGGDRDDERDQP